MNFIDVHCHLHDVRISSCLSAMIQRAQKSGVRYMVSCATKEKNFERTLLLGQEYSSIVPCLGIHPWFVQTASCNWKENLGQKIEHSICGIGETGLDFTDKAADREQQIQVFSFQVHLANELKRPIQIHVRKAWDALIHVLKKNGPLKVPGMLHSYSGSADLVKQLLPYGVYFSFSGAITRKNARKTIESLQAVPVDRILLETDAPDMLPDCHLPEQDRVFYQDRILNQPSYLPLIARVGADHYGMSHESFVERVYENSSTVLAPLLT
ncbi:MAG: DNAase [Acidobacteria bacterium]|nr:MAG: DNAase [Acidobacteriota bacterium]